MGVAITMKDYLDESGLEYDLRHHPREVVASRIAQSCHISGNELVKSVLVTTDHGPVMAVVPATRKVDLMELGHELGERIGLASGEAIEEIFFDCDLGAIPGCGPAYGMEMIVDRDIEKLEDIYFEAGDHQTLVHMKGSDYQTMMSRTGHFADIASPAM